MAGTGGTPMNDRPSTLDRLIRACLEQKAVVALLLTFAALAGALVAPFDWDLWGAPRSPVPVDAIPDIGENQQIVFTDWPGRSPQDVEDQVTYPLTTALLGVPGVKTVRSLSMFGFSSIYLIFDEGVEFYWSRARILEKLNSLPAGSLPEGVAPALGPDATALGQVYWYTLEGRDEHGNPAGGWDLHELRTVQDWVVRYALQGAEGVSEVASVGGFVQEYQVDVDPDALRAFGVTLDEVYSAVRDANLDVGARTIEVNRVEYTVRGLGFVKSVDDLERSVVRSREGVPVLLRDVARVALGPAQRLGVLDKEGAEVVGGVVVVRHGANPLETIGNVKRKIEEIAPGLPVRTLEDGRTSRVTIVPFYDRSGLIHETLETLYSALINQILITIIVVIVMVSHLRAALLVSALLPAAVLMCFVGMKGLGVDANVVALAGIAIAIGTMVDMGVVLTENILKGLKEAPEETPRIEVVYESTREVGSAVLTAISTTVIGFLPVFAMTGQEGKLFSPLAYTKTLALIASVMLALAVIPGAAYILIARPFPSRRARSLVLWGLVALGIALGVFVEWWAGAIVALIGAFHLAKPAMPPLARKAGPTLANIAVLIGVWLLLTNVWEPLGPAEGFLRNALFTGGVIGLVLVVFKLLEWAYAPILRVCLAHKAAFLALPALLVATGASVWLGFDRVFAFVPATAERIGVERDTIRSAPFWVSLSHAFPGLGKEFMPPLDEGSFLLMPTVMPHASITEATEALALQDMLITQIPEVESAVGKLGRAESALDPAPISMIETVINYKPEYISDERGRRINFRFDQASGEFERDEHGGLIPDPDGRPYRQWRDHIRSPRDIWNEVEKAASVPGVTGAPYLQPISARLVMLQSGIRAPMAVQIRGPDLETIEGVALEIEALLRDVPTIETAAVIADRVVGRPYVEIHLDRDRLARHGVRIADAQRVIETAIGGAVATTTVEGRERYPVRVRYARELRDGLETLPRVLIVTEDGAQVPLEEVADVRTVRGPEMIRGEDTFLVGYVLFDRRRDVPEVRAVEDARALLQARIDDGSLSLPPGVSYRFAGSWENQARAQKTLALVLPVSLFAIFVLMYMQFRSMLTTAMVFTGIFVAGAGGFLMLWLYAQPWFLDFEVLGRNMRELFQAHQINLSVAVWVGFLALFGIACDDGVIIATYLKQSFAKRTTETIEQIRAATVAAGLRRVRPCLMTTATTLLALLPILTSTGRGSDIMTPMAIPSVGGMAVVVVTMFVVPTLYCWREEWRLRLGRDAQGES